MTADGTDSRASCVFHLFAPQHGVPSAGCADYVQLTLSVATPFVAGERSGIIAATTSWYQDVTVEVV
jgi:hypothetical protein